MASCITAIWSGSTSPQARLTVTLNTSKSDGDTAALDWVLEYVAHGYAANVTDKRDYTVTINGTAVKSGSYSIDGVKTTTTITSGTAYVDKGTAAKTVSFSVSFAFNLSWSGVYAGTKTASGSISIPAKTTYTVSYNANGGAGAPASQTKTYGTTLKLSSTKPTRTGYSFQGWATSSGGGVTYAAGANYTANAAVTLYAVWKAVTYTVSYNANGGTNAPASQTKTYGTTLKLTSAVPDRQNYTFRGWATSASATTATYAAGANYTENAAVTLYAVWDLAYVKPKIYNLSVMRCDENQQYSDDGTCALVRFTWETTEPNPTAYITVYREFDYSIHEHSVNLVGNSGESSILVGDFEFNPEYSYELLVTVSDDGGESESLVTLNSATFPLDAKAGNDGVAFGKSAELGKEKSLGGRGVAEFAFDGKFNEPVYGKALGMDRLPAIPEGANFNNYIETGCYAVYSNTIATSCANCPVDRAGRLEVWSATGEGVRAAQWSYLRQRYIPYNRGNAVWEREVTRGEDNVWNYYPWWRSSLTPDASEKLYTNVLDKAAMTIALTENTVLGAVSTYSRIPFNKSVLSTSGRLTLSNNSIRIGSGIQHIKVSGQVLVSPGSINGLRHIRIQKVSDGTTSSIAWNTIKVAASTHTIFVQTPIIVSVKEGDLLNMVFYTGDASDSISSGTATNGLQTYLTVEEL